MLRFYAIGTALCIALASATWFTTKAVMSHKAETYADEVVKVETFQQLTNTPNGILSGYMATTTPLSYQTESGEVFSIVYHRERVYEMGIAATGFGARPAKVLVSDTKTACEGITINGTEISSEAFRQFKMANPIHQEEELLTIDLVPNNTDVCIVRRNNKYYLYIGNNPSKAIASVAYYVDD